MSPRRLSLAAIALLVVIGTAAQAFTFSYAVASWVETDRKGRSIPAPFEYSAFMLFLWPLLAPYYLFRSRRWRGLALGIGLILLANVPDLGAIAVYYLWGGD